MGETTDDAAIINADEEATLEPIADDETIETLTEKLKAEQEARRHLTARAKKAEDALKKAPKPVSQESKPEKKESPEISRDEVVLLAKGFEEKDIEYLQLIATGKNISLKDAQKDELFMAYKEKMEQEKKSAKAKLGASKGSGVSQPKDVVTPNMSAADHKALWAKVQG